jgi:hypothetical protein
MARIDRPAAIPREISSRSSSLSARAALCRTGGAIPPYNETIRWTPLLFLRSSAREIDEILSPCFQRDHNSALCADVNQIRDVTI